jgi:GDPmannose 4,6-dehydratase
LRPTEVHVLHGDASKARNLLGWKPKLSMQQLCRMMVDADMELALRERTLVDAGHFV